MRLSFAPLVAAASLSISHDAWWQSTDPGPVPLLLAVRRPAAG
jgi:hypothetical protein